MKKIFHFTYLILLSLIMCFLCHNTAGAQVTFGYDAAGNRVSRVIKLPAKSPNVEKQYAEQSVQKVHNEMLKDFSVQIYPNPTKGDLTVEIQNIKDGKTANLRLYDMSGSFILQKTDVRNIECLNISNLPDGIYVLKITSGDSSTEWKIVKQ